MYPGTLLMVMHVGFSSSCGHRHLGVFEIFLILVPWYRPTARKKVQMYLGTHLEA